MSLGVIAMLGPTQLDTHRDSQSQNYDGHGGQLAEVPVERQAKVRKRKPGEDALKWVTEKDGNLIPYALHHSGHYVYSGRCKMVVDMNGPTHLVTCLSGCKGNCSEDSCSCLCHPLILHYRAAEQGLDG